MTEMAGGKSAIDNQNGVDNDAQPRNVILMPNWATPKRATLHAVGVRSPCMVASSPAGSSPNPHPEPMHLPRASTRFIGRRQLLQDVLDRLHHLDTRLITLTGPGGIGKTRLALEVATVAAASDPSRRTLFIPLAQVAEPALLPSAIATALGLKETRGRSINALLVEKLAAAPHLLVLDNFEHLLDAAPTVSDLIASGDVTVLVTSREVLRLYGEQVIPVPPLELPSGGPGSGGFNADTSAPQDVTQDAEAVNLFLDRARAAHPTLPTTPDDLRAIAEICRRLDGLPLAIELAAARAAVLPPRALVARLKTRLPLLTGGPRDAPARQRTLRDAIAWSFDVLSLEEKALFRRLAVFRGASLEAIDAVCCAPSAGPRASSVQLSPLETPALDGVTSLAQKSLLGTVPSPDALDGEPWYTMLETIREFALEQLRDSGELDIIQRRHILYYLNLAEAAEPLLLGPDQTHWYAHLEREHDNIREALRVCEERGYVEPALRLATALWWFWFVHGHATEARQRFTRLLDRFPAHPSDGPRALRRAKALEAAGRLAAFQGDAPAARALQEQALHILEALDDTPGIFAVLHGLALVAEQDGDYTAARSYLERALGAARALGDPVGIGTSLCNLGPVLHAQGDSTAARAAVQEALEIYEQVDTLRGQCHGWLTFALIACDEGDYPAARAHVERALTLYRRLADPRATAIPLATLARIDLAEGAHEAAERHLRDALDGEWNVGDWAGVAFILERWAELDATRHDAARALTLAGAANAIRAAAGTPLHPHERERHLSHLQSAHAALDPAAAHAAGALGTSLATRGIEHAIAFALGADRTPAMVLDPDLSAARAQSTVAPPVQPVPASPATPATPATPTAPGPPLPTTSEASPLSPREHEVAALIAHGHTNRQIAATLHITEGTAANHVLHILTKLGFSSRAQIASWVASRAVVP